MKYRRSKREKIDQVELDEKGELKLNENVEFKDVLSFPNVSIIVKKDTPTSKLTLDLLDYPRDKLEVIYSSLEDGLTEAKNDLILYIDENEYHYPLSLLTKVKYLINSKKSLILSRSYNVYDFKKNRSYTEFGERGVLFNRRGKEKLSSCLVESFGKKSSIVIPSIKNVVVFGSFKDGKESKDKIFSSLPDKVKDYLIEEDIKHPSENSIP